ncbi:RDD family protein [Kitasatospora cinereorecta]|uniref:RDD family protein n=1 Tax=Kitasatospora cinereorecta TaxID=285560 RepID=A0ABW0VL24_9ACTN
MSDLVTGEAVVLGLRTAKLPSRALARLLDAVVQFIGFVIAIVVLAVAAPDLEEAAVQAVSLSVFVLFTVVVPVVVETLSHGRSLGKAAFGLRVVREDGGPVRFRHALVRGLVGVVEFGLMAAPATITSLVSAQGRRLGDIFAGTLVVRERLPKVAREQGALPPVSPELMNALGGDLVSLDLSAVPDGLWLAIRQFLGRLAQLDPAVAAGMAQRLAGDLAGHTGRAVPYGLQPVAYLGAVLAERQRREWARAVAGGAVPGFPPPYAASPVPYGTVPVPYGAAPAPYGPAPTSYGPAPVPYGAPPARVLGYPQPSAPVPAPPQVPLPPQAPPVPEQPPAQAGPSAGGFAPPA